jgi:hypothetical protein
MSCENSVDLRFLFASLCLMLKPSVASHSGEYGVKALVGQVDASVPKLDLSGYEADQSWKEKNNI